MLIRQRDGQRERFPWSHGQITRESSAGTGEVPDRALSLERTRVVRDSALHGEALVETKREGHGGLAGWLSVEGYGSDRKAGIQGGFVDGP